MGFKGQGCGSNDDEVVKNALLSLLNTTTSANCNFSNFTEYSQQEYSNDPASGGLYRNYCVYGDIYFDSQCRAVTSEEFTRPICDVGAVSWRASPIFLLLSGKRKLDTSNPTIVKFSLDYNKPEQTSVWYASELQPLLVYDP